MTSIKAIDILDGIMSTPPVRSETLQPASNNQSEVVHGAAPRGIGDALTTMQSMGMLPKELGYVESAVQWFGRWIASIFKAIFYCFFPPEEPIQLPVQPPSPPLEPSEDVTPPPSPPPAPKFPRIAPELQEKLDLLEAFHALSEEAQKQIYIDIGKSKLGRFSPSKLFTSFEAKGKSEVENDPLLLKIYFLEDEDSD